MSEERYHQEHHHHDDDHHDHHHEHHHHDLPDPGNTDQLKALLTYMCEHNESHAHELEHLLPKLSEFHADDAAGLVRDAMEAYEKGNALLRKALDSVG